MLDGDAQPPQGLDHHPRVLAVEGAGQDARPVGHRGDDQRAVGQALRAGDADDRPGRRTRPGLNLISAGSCSGIGFIPEHLIRDGCQKRVVRRSPSSSGRDSAMRNRFCRDVAPEISATCAALQPRSLGEHRSGSPRWPFPCPGGAVTATRRAPARSPRTALRCAPGWATTGRIAPSACRTIADHGSTPSNSAEPTRTQRRPLLDGRLEVVRHPHRQLVQGQARPPSQRLAQLAERDERRPGRLGRRPQRGHRHQADDRDRPAGRDRLGVGEDLDRDSSHACSASPEVLTCRQTAGGSATIRRGFVEDLQELERVDRVDHADHRKSLLDLVGLQVADQMPADGIRRGRPGLPPSSRAPGDSSRPGRGPRRPRAAGSTRAGSAWSRRPGGRTRRGRPDRRADSAIRP